MVRPVTRVKDEGAGLPALPTPAVRSRITSLGYGSGPWERPDLIAKWGEAVTGKTIQEAKDLGWLVSPYQGQYFVPSARDLMVAAWLPPAQRVELVASRTLAKTGMRYWCLSAWARSQGLLFSEPVFVTDLSPAGGGVPAQPGPGFSLAALGERARALSKSVRRIPFATNTIVVTALGELSTQRMIARVNLPAPARRLQRRDVDPAALALSDDEPAPWVIEYDVSRNLDDKAWLIAFLNALRLPRILEGMRKLAEQELEKEEEGEGSEYSEDLLQRATSWAAFFAPPSPNENWKSVLASGSVPYLLVPPSLWDETISLSASRAFDELSGLRRQLGA